MGKAPQYSDHANLRKLTAALYHETINAITLRLTDEPVGGHCNISRDVPARAGIGGNNLKLHSWRHTIELQLDFQQRHGAAHAARIQISVRHRKRIPLTFSQ